MTVAWSPRWTAASLAPDPTTELRPVATPAAAGDDNLGAVPADSNSARRVVVVTDAVVGLSPHLRAGARLVGDGLVIGRAEVGRTSHEYLARVRAHHGSDGKDVTTGDRIREAGDPQLRARGNAVGDRCVL